VVSRQGEAPQAAGGGEKSLVYAMRRDGVDEEITSMIQSCGCGEMFRFLSNWDLGLFSSLKIRVSKNIYLEILGGPMPPAPASLLPSMMKPNK
jgi:hypothetical protein